MQVYFNIFSLLVSTIINYGNTFEFPPYEIEAFSPRGFKISIPDSEGITLFAVHINIDKEMEFLEAGQIARDVVKKRGVRWVYEDKNLRLKVGSKLYFWLYTIVDGLGYRLDNQEYTIQVLKPKEDTPGTLTSTSAPTFNPTKIQDECVFSHTAVLGKRMCKGNVIFFEQFQNSNFWDSNNDWITEKLIPKSQENYFSVIEGNNRYVENGFLVIKPTLLEQKYGENFVVTGNLTLNGCTSESLSKCESRAFSWNILPPILTSRINTRDSFSFKYGVVEIKAKLPKGDWIVPDICLIGRNYGPNSGRIILGRSFGNEDLKLRGKNIGNQVLSQGLQTNETNTLYFYKKMNNNNLWSDNFHIYKSEWTPEYIKFMVDSEEIGKLEPKIKIHEDIGGTILAPFDKEFFISLGVHVGGLVDFPDDSVNRGKPKPWINEELRNVVKFWQSKEQWYSTWSDDSKLKVDYVKVTAL